MQSWKVANRPGSLKPAKYLAAALAPVLVALASLPAVAQSSSGSDEGLFAKSQATLPNGQLIRGFDISYVDVAQGLYLLADRTNKAVDVFSTGGPTFLFQAGQGLFAGATGNNNTSGPDGVLLVNNSEIWAGDGDSTIKVLSLKGGFLLKVISTGPASQDRVDEMCLDPIHNIVMAANNAASPFPIVTFISGQTKTILKQLTLDGTNGTPVATNGAEQCQWNPRTGQFYISIPEINGPGDNSAPGGVMEVNPGTLTVTQVLTVPLTACSGPQGMAIGPATGLNGGTGQILLGCVGGPHSAANGNPTAIVDDNLNPATIFAVPNEWGSDMVTYNSATNHYALARSSATPNQVVGLIDAATGSADPDLVVKPVTPGNTAGHSIAADPVHNLFFFPTPGPATGQTLCSSVGGNDNQGCITALTTGPADRDEGVVKGPSSPVCTAPGGPVVKGTQMLTSAC